LLPLLVFLFAFGFRLTGIGWGLQNDLHNQTYHPDEQIILGNSQALDPGHLGLTPGFYNYGTLYLTALNVAGSMVKTYGGGEPDRHDASKWWPYEAKWNLAGRVISSLAGAFTAVFIFLMLRRFTRPFGALFGALVVAIAPAFVVHSRFQTVDVLATMLLTVSLYLTTLLLPATSAHADPPAWSKKLVRYAVLAGLLAGLSAGTKYTGILAVIPLIVACFMIDRSLRVKALVGGIVASAVGFFLGTPGSVLDNGRFMQSLAYEAHHVATGHGLLFIDVPSGYIYHLINLGAGIQPLLLLLCAIGIVMGLVKREKWLWLLLSFSLPYYLLIGGEKVLFLRYTFPLYVIAAAGFGWWMGWAHERKGKHLFAVMAGIFGLGLSLMIAAEMTTWMMGTDPRDQVALELKQLAKDKPGTTVGSASDPWYYSPPLIPDSTGDLGMIKLKIGEMLRSQSPRFISYIPEANGQLDLNSRFDWDTRLITDIKPDYIVYSSLEQYDVDRLQNSTDLDTDSKLMVDRYKQFQVALTASYAPFQTGLDDAGMRIQDLEYIRPYLWVWKRKDLP
jgi:hypothetical protein